MKRHMEISMLELQFNKKPAEFLKVCFQEFFRTVSTPPAASGKDSPDNIIVMFKQDFDELIAKAKNNE